MSTTSTAPAVGAARRGHHPGIALAVIVTCQMMLMIDNTVVNVAMPTISTDLHFSTTSLSWVMNAYALTFGGLLLLGGRSGDILGRRRVFVGGLAVFTAASLLGGFATTDWWLLAARALQGVGAAAAAPTALSLITTNFPEGPERNRAIGLYGAVAGAGGGIGLVLGGMLVSWVSWRWVLFINVPIGVAVILLAPMFVHESPRLPGRFDLAGALASTAGVSAMVYGFVRASEQGWSDGLTIGSFVAAVVLLAGFLLHESRAAQPITPLGLFRDRDRAGAYAARVPLLAGMMGMFYFLTLFVQDVMHFSPLATGFAFLPTTTAMLVMARLAPGMLRRLGSKAGVSLGIAVGLGAMVWLTQLHPGSGYADGVLGPILLFGFGMALPFIGLTVLSVSRVSATEAGAASGMVNVAQQVGGALGLAILVTVFGTAQRHAAAAPFTGSPADHARTVLADGISTAFVAGSVAMGIALLIAATVFTGRLIPPRGTAVPPAAPTRPPAASRTADDAPLPLAAATEHTAGWETDRTPVRGPRSRDRHPPAAAARGFDRDLRRLCAVVVAGAIMTILDTTIVNVAVNSLGVRFHTSLSTIQWVLTGYMLALSMAIPLTGWAVSRFGARTMWLVSLGLFIVGSVLCGASWSVVSLIIFRVVQGFGGGMIMPVGQQMLARAAGPERMGRVMVVVAVPAMLAPVLGPVLGGLIVDHLDWRWMFYVNVPVCALALLLALRFLPREDVDRRPDQRLDILGLALLSPGLAAVVYGLSEAGNGAGFGSTRVLTLLCVGAALVVAFVLHALRRGTAALVDVRVFRRRAFTAANVGIACYSMAVFGLMMVIPLYAQLVRHDSPLQAGMLLAPLGLGAMATMPLAGRLTDRFGPRWVGVIGVAVAMVGAGVLTGLGVGTSVAVPIVALLVVGLGHGAVIPAISAAGYQGAPREEVPAVTTASNIMLRTASSVGTAVLAVVLQIAIRHRVPGAGGSLAEAAHSAATAPALLTDSFSVAYWWALVLGVLALPILLLIPPRPRPASDPAAMEPAAMEPTERQVLPSAD